MESRADQLPLYLAATVDVQRAVEWLAETNARRTVRDRLLMAALFLKAVATALREVPELNGSWTNGRSTPSPTIDLGVAVARRRGGLVVPVLAAADRRSVDDLMRELRQAVRRARADEPPDGDAAQPTFTVTSLGEQGVQTVFPSILPPQVGGVGFGRVTEQPSAVDGTIVCSPVVTATLAADCRVVDSHRAARFLAALERRLQSPDML